MVLRLAFRAREVGDMLNDEVVTHPRRVETWR